MAFVGWLHNHAILVADRLLIGFFKTNRQKIYDKLFFISATCGELRTKLLGRTLNARSITPFLPPAVKKHDPRYPRDHGEICCMCGTVDAAAAAATGAMSNNRCQLGRVY